MFRRSRFSFRPNVGTAGRPAATPQEAPPANQEASETPRNAGESNNTAPVKDKKSDVTPSDAAASGDGNSQNVEGTSSSAGVQRRKRFSVKPKVAPGRPSALSRTPKSPVKAVSESPLHSGSDLDRPATLNQSGTTAAPKGLQSPRRRRPSEESKQPKMQHKPTPIIFDSSEPSAVSPAVASVEQTHPPAHSSKQSENISDRQVKEVPPRPPERPSLPDKEASEISEKAKTLVSSKSMLSLTPSALSLSRLLNDPSDLQRLVKAQKLRELLREERHKEKKRKRAKAHPKVFTLDPAKMTMRDLIHYLPKSNPMISSLEDSTQENETVLPPSPGREASPEQTQEPEVLPDTVSTREEEEEPEEEQEEALMVPQVKVAEDGSLIIDEESLTVEVQRAKGPNPAENRDPIFERGSTTTYSSFRKLTHVKRWTNEETDMFFLALSMVGTDFSMICQLFPHRARSEIKNKFKREERENAWRIDKAIRERRKLDIEYFSKLLEKILEYQKSKKKLKSLAVKRPPKGKRKTATNKSARKLSDVEEEDEEDDNEVLDLEEDDEGEEEEGEKENEDLCNEGGILVFEAKKKRKRKTRQTAVDAEPNDKKNKLSEKSTEQGEDGIPEDAEEGPPGDHKVSDKSEKTQNVNTAKNPAIKPAKLSRNRAPQPLLPLGRKWSKKLGPSTKAKNTFPCREGESMSDGTSKEQVNEDASPVSQDSRKLADDDISSEEEDTIVKPPRPTRCGRVPKPTKPLTYPAREEVHPSASETTPASTVGSAVSAPKPKRTAKRKNSPQPAQKSKKPKLVTLTASQSDFLDEDDQPWEDEEVEEVELEVCSGKDSSAPAFVPAGLSAAHPEIKEVDETIAELDILAAMPDVLGISQDVLCHDSSCEQPQHETGSAEPCEHQLDLLVDVIDFISSEQTEVSEDQSYNEAAQTLLTIGNLPLISQSAQCQIPIQDYMTGTASVGVIETSHLEKEEKSATPSVSTFGQKVTQTESVATVEQQGSITHSGEMLAIKTSDVPNQESLNKNLPQAKRACFSKVKAKPNLSHISRTAQSKSEPEIPSVKTAEESNTVSPNITESAPALPTSDISSSLVKLTAEPLDSQPDADHVEAGATSSEESFSEIQSRCCSESRFEPSGDWATRGTKSLSQPADENLMSCAETGFKNPANSDSFITEIEKKRQTNLSSAQKSNDKPLPCVSPVEDLPVTQKEESAVASTSQSRRSRMQKVKPRPNLSQASRAVRSKPQTTMQPAEGDSIQNPTNLQPTCTTSTEEQSQSPDPESVLKQSLNLGSTLSPPEERSTNKEKKTDARPNQSTQDNQNSESQFAPREQATREAESTSQFRAESLTSHAETDSAATASQVGQRENADSAPIQKGSVHPPVFATSAEGVPVGHQEGEVASTSQLRRARLQRVKPKPNLPQSLRTARSKPQTSKQLKERESTPTPSLKLPEKTTADTLPQIAYTTSSEERSQTTDNASVLKPSLNLTSTLSPTKEQSANKEKNTDCGLDLDATLSDHSASEYQNSESRFELKRDQDTSDIKLSSDPSKENLKSCVGIAETVFDNSAKSDFAIREVEQESCTDSTPAHKSSEKPPPRVSPAEGVAVSQKGDREVTTISQSRRTRMQRVKPKPNLIQTSRTSRSKPQTIEHSEEKDLSATPNLKLAEKTAEVESQPMRTISSEEQSQSTDPPGVLEPSLNIASTLTSTEELSTNEDKKTNVRLDLVEANAGQSDSENQNLSESRFGLNREQTTSERDVPAVETTQSSCENVTTPDSAVTVSQVGKGDNADSASTQESSVHPAMLVLPVEACNVESKSQLSRSRLHKFKPKPNLPQTSRTTQSKSQSTKDPVILVQVVEKSCSQTSKPESTDYAKEIEAQPVCSGISPEKPSQLSSTHTCTEELSSTEEEKTDGGCGLISSTESQEQNVTPRQRWFPKVKPKPTLASSARTGHTKQNDNKSGPGDSEEIVDTANSKDSHSGHPGSSFGCLAHVNKQQSEQDHPSNDSQVPLVGGTQVSSIQNASTSNTEEIRSYPILQEILPEQVPLDPDEPFFILSLTEIPVSSAGEVLNSAAEHPSCLSATESSIPQPSSVSGESLETAGEGSLSNVPVFTEEKGVMGLNVNPSEFIVHTVEKTVAPHESTTDQPSKLLDNVDSNESEMPATKQRLKSTGRRAKLQVKPTITRRRQTNKILSAEAAESAPTRVTTTPDLAHSSSVQPKAYDAVTEPHRGSFSHDKDIPTDGKDADSSLGTPSSQSSGTTCQRKRKDSVSSLSETNKQIKTTPSHSSPPGKTASEELKVKTPFASKIQSLPEPVASTSHHVASKQSSTLPPKETHSASITLLTQTAVDIKQTPDQSLNSLEPTPSTSQCFAEQSDCGESSFFDEEPTSVSQYFLSDIFTEVEEE